MTHLIDALAKLFGPLTAAWDQEFGRPAPRAAVVTDRETCHGVPAPVTTATAQPPASTDVAPLTETAPCPAPQTSILPESSPEPRGGRGSKPGSAAKPAPRRSRKKTATAGVTGGGGVR